jgi:ssRNA-specific RNase YbeY (16S rRNA maturation enzyme)
LHWTVLYWYCGTVQYCVQYSSVQYTVHYSTVTVHYSTVTVHYMVHNEAYDHVKEARNVMHKMCRSLAMLLTMSRRVVMLTAHGILKKA